MWLSECLCSNNSYNSSSSNNNNNTHTTQQLTKVPILGQSILLGGHVCVDRSSRRSQIKTLRDGAGWLRSGVPLCAFPEGTRSKTGRVMAFKRGAFKMACTAGARVVPLSIVGSQVRESV